MSAAELILSDLVLVLVLAVGAKALRRVDSSTCLRLITTRSVLAAGCF